MAPCATPKTQSSQEAISNATPTTTTTTTTGTTTATATADTISGRPKRPRSGRLSPSSFHDYEEEELGEDVDLWWGYWWGPRPTGGRKQRQSNKANAGEGPSSTTTTTTGGKGGRKIRLSPSNLGGDDCGGDWDGEEDQHPMDNNDFDCWWEPTDAAEMNTQTSQQAVVVGGEGGGGGAAPTAPLLDSDGFLKAGPINTVIAKQRAKLRPVVRNEGRPSGHPQSKPVAPWKRKPKTSSTSTTTTSWKPKASTTTTMPYSSLPSPLASDDGMEVETRLLPHKVRAVRDTLGRLTPPQQQQHHYHKGKKAGGEKKTSHQHQHHSSSTSTSEYTSPLSSPSSSSSFASPSTKPSALLRRGGGRPAPYHHHHHHHHNPSTTRGPMNDYELHGAGGNGGASPHYCPSVFSSSSCYDSDEELEQEKRSLLREMREHRRQRARKPDPPIAAKEDEDSISTKCASPSWSAYTCSEGEEGGGWWPQPGGGNPPPPSSSATTANMMVMEVPHLELPSPSQRKRRASMSYRGGRSRSGSEDEVVMPEVDTPKRHPVTTTTSTASPKPLTSPARFILLVVLPLLMTIVGMVVGYRLAMTYHHHELFLPFYQYARGSLGMASRTPMTFKALTAPASTTSTTTTTMVPQDKMRQILQGKATLVFSSTPTNHTGRSSSWSFWGSVQEEGDLVALPVPSTPSTSGKGVWGKLRTMVIAEAS